MTTRKQRQIHRWKGQHASMCEDYRKAASAMDRRAMRMLAVRMNALARAIRRYAQEKIGHG